MAAIIKTQENGTLSFGDYTLPKKAKEKGFTVGGDTYGVKTFRELTKLEKNDTLVFESIPGTNVSDFRAEPEGIYFSIEGSEDADVTVGADPETVYNVTVDNDEIGLIRSSLGGKLTFAIELAAGERKLVKIVR
jgi:hypothetical protein